MIVFVAVGSRNFQFDRLLSAIDDAIESGDIYGSVFAQIGASNYMPKHYRFEPFLSHDEFEKYLTNCDVLITHGGTGAIVTASKLGKKIIAVPRLCQYGEAVDNHQMQIVSQFETAGFVESCIEPSGIGTAFKTAIAKQYGNYASNTNKIIDDLREFLAIEAGCESDKREKGDRPLKKILVVSNMYPCKKHPSSGIFVRRFVEELEEINVDYVLSVMRTTNGTLAKTLRYLKFYIETFFKCLFCKVDLVYIHYASHSSAPVLAASRIRQLPFYVNVHGSDVVPENERQQKFQKYTRDAVVRSQKVIVPSSYFAQVVQEKYCISSQKLFIYPSGGVDPSVFHPLSSDEITRIRSRHNLNPKAITVCYAGRVSEGKGWDVYAEALKKVFDDGFQVNAILIGDGSQMDECNKLISKLNLESRITKRCLLPQDELCEYYNASDIFVFPTRREGESLGLVAIEAMACGTPVLASDFAAPRYYIEEGINGFKFDRHSPESLAELIERFASGSISKSDLCEGALKTAQNYLDANTRSMLRSIIAG